MKDNLAKIINKILNDSELSSEEKYILIILKSMKSHNQSTINISYSEISDMSGIKRRNNISATLKSLKSKNYIIYKRGGGKVKNTYTFSKRVTSSPSKTPGCSEFSRAKL